MAIEEEPTVKEVSLFGKIGDDCKALQKEKDETLEDNMAGELESIEQRLKKAIEAKSKADNAIKELNGKLKSQIVNKLSTPLLICVLDCKTALEDQKKKNGGGREPEKGVFF